MGRLVRPGDGFHAQTSMVASVMLGGPVNVEFPRAVHPLELSQYLSVDEDTWELVRHRVETLDDLHPELGDAVRSYIVELLKFAMDPDPAGAIKACVPIIALDTSWRDSHRTVRAMARLLESITGTNVHPSPSVVNELKCALHPIAERSLVSALLAQAISYRLRSLKLRPECLKTRLEKPNGDPPPRSLTRARKLYAKKLDDFSEYLHRMARLDSKVTVKAGRRFVFTPEDYDPVWRGYLRTLRRSWKEKDRNTLPFKWWTL